jgi:hypothetical protein
MSEVEAMTTSALKSWAIFSRSFTRAWSERVKGALQGVRLAIFSILNER